MSFLSAIGHGLKSRTVWMGIGTAALGAGELAAQYSPQILSMVPATTPFGAGLTIGLGVLTVIARVRAKQPLGPVVNDTIAKTIDVVHDMQAAGKPKAAQDFLAVAPAVKAKPMN